jgi:hypothetical protein
MPEQREPMPSDAVFETEILGDPVVRADKSIQLALQMWLNGNCTLERAALAVMRALAIEKRDLQAKLGRLEKKPGMNAV